MRTYLVSIIAFAVLASGAACTSPITVDRFDDDATATACTSAASDCSLRGAVLNANATAGAVQIVIPAGTYVLTRAGAEEDAGSTGDLDVTDSVDLVGAGTATTIINGNSLDRVFDIDPAGTSGVVVSMSKLTVLGGKTNNGSPVPGSGGGIRNKGQLSLSEVDVHDNQIFGNGDGAGIQNLGTLTVNLANIYANRVGWVDSHGVGDGGGLSNGMSFPTVVAGTATVTNSTIRDNIAAFTGGGILNDYTSTLTLSGSTVSGNKADTSWGVEGNSVGGGMFNYGALVVTNSTVTGNLAAGNFGDSDGGGILSDLGTTTLVNVTIANNTLAGTSRTGTGLSVIGGNIALTNTIVSNGCDDWSDLGGTGTFTSSGGNLESPGNTCHLTLSTDFTSASTAGLVALASNGGPTQTRALSSSSLAINHGLAGPCPTTDQRGYARTVGACDTGAFEYGAVP